MPAIGASTTGDSMTCRPSRSGGSTGTGPAGAAGGVIRSVTGTDSPASAAVGRIGDLTGETQHRLGERLGLVEVGQVPGAGDRLDADRGDAVPELVPPPVEQEHGAREAGQRGGSTRPHDLVPGSGRGTEPVATGDDRVDALGRVEAVQHTVVD